MRGINKNAPVKCSKTIMIHADQKRVWDVLTNINQWATWQTEIFHPKQSGELISGSTFSWKSGAVKIHSFVHTVEPCRYFGWTGRSFGLFAIHNWTLTEANGQTKVEVDESMEGFFASLFKKSFNRNLEGGMQFWLEALKKECEKD